MVRYLLIFADPDAASTTAERLRHDEDFADVRVGEVEPLAEAADGAQGDDREWGVLIGIDTIDDPSSAVARALADRLAATASEHGGRLDGVR